MNEEQLKKAIVEAHRRGDTRAAKLLADKLTRMRQSQNLTDEQINQAYSQPGRSIDPDAKEYDPGQARMQELQRQIADATGVEVPESLLASGASAGQGLVDIYRGAKRLVGMGEDISDREKRIMEEISESYPISSTIGRVTGQALPFAPLGAAAGAGRAAAYQMAGKSAPALSRGQQIGSQAALGATEGGLITAGVNDEATEGDILSGAGIGGGIGGAVEAVLPGIGRIFSGLGKRPVLNSDGTMPKYAEEAVKKAGLSPDEAKRALVDIKVKPGDEITGEDLERYLRFNKLGIPASKGDITGDFGQKSTESRLLESTQDELGEPMRDLRLSQSQAFTGLLDDTVKQLGVPEGVGERVKAALSQRRASLNKNKNQLYSQLAEEAENVEQIPILADLPDATQKRRIGRLSGTEVKALDELLLEFGVGDPGEVSAFAEKGNPITPLTINNSEEFLQAVNAIERKDQSGSIKVITGPLKESVDRELDVALRELEEAGNSLNLGSIARKARSATRQVKTEFSPQSITGRLIGVKRDGVTPIVEASNVLNSLFTRGSRSRVEDLQRTVESLNRAGKEGKQALNDLQAAAVARFIDDTLGAATRNIKGERIISGPQFQRSLDKFGADELQVLFGNKPDVKKRLDDLRKVAEDITIPSGAQPKGSASVILDLANKMAGTAISQKLAPVGWFFEGLSNLQGKAVRRKEAREAGKAVPRYTKKELRQIAAIRETMPQMAAILGVSATQQDDDE